MPVLIREELRQKKLNMRGVGPVADSELGKSFFSSDHGESDFVFIY